MKLSPLTIIVIGIAVVIAAAGVALNIFMPNMEEARYKNEQANALFREANKQPQANKKVQKAIEDVKNMQLEWQRVVAVKTPPNNLADGGINLAVNRWQLTHDSLHFRNNIQRAVNSQVRRGGVTVVQGPVIPLPPNSASQIVEYYNFPAIKFPVLIFDLGTITVRGTYSQILENVRSWKYMPNYLAVADGLQLTGTTPTLTGTYNVSLVAYIRGDMIAPPVPDGGGGGGNTPGGGGSPGGPPPGGVGGVAGPPKGGNRR